MSMVAHTHPFVIGVDAHARNHALAILACPTGEVLDEGQFPATGAGLQRAVDWVARRTGGDLDTLWVVEGVGTYGARLARAAADAGYSVAEAARMNARANRGVGKSDPSMPAASHRPFCLSTWRSCVGLEPTTACAPRCESSSLRAITSAWNGPLRSTL